MKKHNLKKRKKSEAGFIAADFLFSFVLVIGIGIFIFALTFSLATVEIAQYIVWSSARTYSSAHVDEATSNDRAQKKFSNLSAQFPLLTGQGGDSPWFILDDFKAQDHKTESTFSGKVTPSDLTNKDGGGEFRQPWTGASASFYFKLFSSLKIPFFGKITNDEDLFKFRVYAFIIRNPSAQECRSFFQESNRFQKGIQALEPGFSALGGTGSYVSPEDNGC